MVVSGRLHGRDLCRPPNLPFHFVSQGGPGCGDAQPRAAMLNSGAFLRMIYRLKGKPPIVGDPFIV